MPYVKAGAPQSKTGAPGVLDVFHSENVYANHVPIALWLDPQGPEASVYKALINPEYKIDAVIQQEIEGETENEAIAMAVQRQFVAKGVIKQEDIDAGNKPADPNAPSDPTGGTAKEGNKTGTAKVESNVDDTILYKSNLTGITYTVKSVTKSPGVIFGYDVATIAPKNGLTVQEVCDNLRFLIINCFDPIKKEFPDAFLTCTFRSAGKGSPSSLHPKGMACDIQYAKASKADYYKRALWIKDNTSFDQFILEYKTTGTRLPWHHLSFNKNGNRGQVLTFMNDRNYKGPGVQGLYDLSGL